MSNSDFAKKMAESEDLAAFVVAYERVTGEVLRVSDSGESPDFICMRPNGQRIGIELTKIYVSSFEQRQLEDYRDMLGFEPISGWDIAYAVADAAYIKSKKLRSGAWRLKRNILVLQVYECPLEEVTDGLDELRQEMASNSAFQQLWVAGFYEQGAYSEMDLYCIKPARLKGYHQRPFEKPYG